MSASRPSPTPRPELPSDAESPLEGPWDVAIVGAGPIGIETAITLRAQGHSVIQLESGNIGETIAWYAPNTRFFSSPERIAICGVPLVTVDQSKATREEYLAYLRGVVEQFDLPIHSGRHVVAVRRGDDGSFRLATVVAPRRASYNAKGATSEGSSEEPSPQEQQPVVAHNVVLAIGDMHHPQRLNIPGENLPHVSHYFEEPHRYFRRRVLIVGGKNSAVEAAIRCRRAGARVTLSYRGPELDADRIKYWLMPEIRAMIRDGRLRFLPNTHPRHIDPERVLLEQDGGDLLAVPADDVLLMTGYTQDSSLFESAGIELVGRQRAPRHDEDTMETNVPGLYIAGTAVAGTQLSGVQHFIETCHVHVDRIAAHLAGRRAEGLAAPHYELPES